MYSLEFNTHKMLHNTLYLMFVDLVQSNGVNRNTDVKRNETKWDDTKPKAQKSFCKIGKIS